MYQFLFRSFDEIYNLLVSLSEVCTIFAGHTKQSSLLIDNSMVQVNDIHLTGKLKVDLARDVDAIGVLEFDKGNEFVRNLNFKNFGRDVTTKARSIHLRNATIKLSEVNPEAKTITYFWNEIFPEIVKEPIVIDY